MNHAIIVAAGSSTRFAGPQAKQFTPLAGKPLIIHTLQRFESCLVIDDIALVLSAEGVDEFERLRDRYELSKLSAIVTGGLNRAESVRNGLDAVQAGEADIVAVHDGARPLVTDDEITRTIRKAEQTGAACLVAPVTDTIKKTADSQIVCTVDRTVLRHALTPQAFRYELLRDAFAMVELDGRVTDECGLLERAGVPVAAVEGSRWNIKVTHREDLIVAEALLQR
jgi:2-C-methyl-D-erythritol 4-phosphate cytidylyltransferase